MKDRLEAIKLPVDATVLEALRAINDGGLELAFVCDREGSVLGLLTDGDIRRCILAGASLESRGLEDCMKRDFVRVGPEAARPEVLDLMGARGVSQIPVLDTEARLVGIHTLRDFLGPRELENWAVVMAGGLGTRLRPLTERIPKPMLPVAGRPILERIVLHLVAAGIRRVFVSINHLGHVVRDHFGDGEGYGCQIGYLEESDPLGTAGSLGLLPDAPTAPVLVMNGDLVTNFDVADMIAFHERGGYSATCGVRPHRVEIPFGVVETDGQSVRSLVEKPTLDHLINAGIYVLSPDVVEGVSGSELVHVTHLIADCLRRGEEVGSYLLDSDWIDVGRPNELARARGQENQ